MIAKVIKIIDEYKIVLNVGYNDSISEGNLFKIVENNGVEVLDPDTGESFGTLDVTKATVKVIKLYPKMCICENEIPDINIKDEFQIIVRPKRLKVNLNDVSGGYNEKKISPIKLGDKALLVTS